jgi:putative NADH-flavin reductase
MNILIFGASGATGHELVKQALEQGHRVTAFVRTPIKLKVEHQHLSIFPGDVTNSSAVQEAIKGKEAVLSALGASSPFKYDQAVVDGMANIVKAMEKENVRRLIYMSAINVKESRKDAGLLIRVLAPILLRTENAGHEARENIIRQTNLEWTIVRAAGLTNGGHKGIYRSGEDVRSKGILSNISRKDVADFMLKQLADKKFVHKTPKIMY